MSPERIAIEEPRTARLLFSDSRSGWLWLRLRLYIGWICWEAGWHKLVDPRWWVLAWRNAGWIGLERWLLPIIGTPWQPGHVFRPLKTAHSH